MVPKANIAATYDLSKVPTTWLIKAPSTVASIVDVINQQAYNMYSGAGVYGVGSLVNNADSAYLPFAIPTFGKLSNTYFIVRVPMPFLMGLFHTVGTDGAIVYNNNFDALRLSSTLFATGWSMCTLNDASGAFKESTFASFDGSPTTFSVVVTIPGAGSSVCRAMRKLGAVSGGNLLVDASAGAYDVAYFLVKSATARNVLPRVEEIMDVKKLFGVFGTTPLAESNIQPATPAKTSESPPDPTPSVAAAEAPKKGFLEQNRLYIYSGAGVIGSMLVFVLLYWWLFRSGAFPPEVDQPP
jgi:hypothetical protein